MSIESDGTVTFSINHKASSFGWDDFHDVSIKPAKVVAVYGPTSQQNHSKKFVEYEVVAADQVGLTSCQVRYFRCRMASAFGGIGDFSRWTPRITPDDSEKIVGSLVLILCLSGDRRNAYIIGGIPHPDDPEKDLGPKEFPYYELEFNGINLEINKDGELTLFRRGPTDEAGKVKDDKGEGATFKLTNDGNILLGQKDETIFFKLDKSAKVATLKADDGIEFETGKKFNIKAPQGVHINPNGPDTQAFVRGTKYRANEGTMNNNLKEQLLYLSTQIKEAIVQVTALYSAVVAAGASLALASEKMAIPTVINHTLSSVPLAAAGTSLSAAAAPGVALTKALTQMDAHVNFMMGAIALFESSSSTYLSPKHNFSDLAGL